MSWSTLHLFLSQQLTDSNDPQKSFSSGQADVCCGVVQGIQCIDHFARCKQHWSRSTSCFSFLTLHKSWDKIQPTEHIKLNQKV